MKHLKLFENHQEYEAFVSGGTMVKPNVSHCAQEGDVYYNPYVDPYNGYAYVDLGLPSGTMWATMNVGASSETDYGLYFAWGETQGYADASTKKFRWSDYKYGTSSNLTKYNSTDSLTNLEFEDDAAAVNMGGEWHMPTKDQCEELFNTTYVTNTWVENYNGSGVNGHLFTSVSNGNTLFIPAAGFYQEGEMHYGYGIGEVGTVWASSIGDYVYNACCFGFNNNEAAIIDIEGRCIGRSVRGVIG